MFDFAGAFFCINIIFIEPPHLNWSSAMFRKRRTDNDEQTTTAGRDYHEIEVLMGQVMARLDAIRLMHISPVKQIAKLQKIIELLSRGEIVQNRQLKNVVGTEGYARYLSDCEYQKYLVPC